MSRDRWVSLAEKLRDDPTLLARIRKQDEDLAKRLADGLRSLAISVAGEVWRDTREGFGARAEQLIPGTPGSFSDRTDWVVWLLMGGRGSGKSRTGAEATREMILGREWMYETPVWALVGQTLDAVRIDMVENTLLPILPSGSVAKWNRGPCELWLHLPDPEPKPGERRRRRKGRKMAYLKGYSSESPRKLRGPNFHGAWADELGTWSDANRSPKALDTTFSNLMLALRARDGGTWTPRIVATTTPRSVNLLRNPEPNDALNPGPGLYDDPSTVVSNMSTLANIENLAEHYIASVVRPLEGTRLYEQEVLGHLIDESAGALWSSELIDEMTVLPTWPHQQGGGLERIAIGVDPSIGAGRGDECGIVVCGKARDGNGYILDDRSMRAPAKTWAIAVAEAYDSWGADAVIVETNQGGELVDETLGRYAPNLPIAEVWAKKGKALRAEPVALLSDQGKVKLAGKQFERLTRQMRTWDPEESSDSPDRLDAMVYAMLWLMPVSGGYGELITVRRSGRRR